MKIADDFKLDDGVSGIKFEVLKGGGLDRLRISSVKHGILARDFWFDKDGKFDGTGSSTLCYAENKQSEGCGYSSGLCSAEKKIKIKE